MSFLGLPFPLSDTQALLRKSIHRFAQSEIKPRAHDIDAQNIFPRDLWPAMGSLGLFGITVSEDYGGVNLGYLSHCLVVEEISRASAAVGLSYAAHSNLCMNQIARFGTPEQKEKFLPPLCSGEFLGALAMSETNAGSDVMSMRLTGKETAEGYRLNGSKMWITNGPEADVIIVYAKTKPETPSRGITAFIVEKDRPGFKPAQKMDKLGMRGSDTCELVFENCFIPAENILGQLNRGVEVLMTGLNYERVILAAGPVGIMQACLDLVLPYVAERKQFDQAIGQFQLIQAKVADMYTQLNTARCYLYTLAQSCDQGQITAHDAASLILYAAENATQMALQTIQCLGGNGYTNEYSAGRLLRDAKLYEIGAGTSEIRRIIIGRYLVKQFSESVEL